MSAPAINLPEYLDHPLYEIEMLYHTAARVKNGPFTTPKDQLDNNAFLESFASHARCLDEFFSFGEHKDYVRVTQYGLGIEKLLRIVGVQEASSAQVVHLGVGRQPPSPTRTWPVSQIANELRPRALDFLKKAAANEGLMNFKDNRSRTARLIGELVSHSTNPRFVNLSDQVVGTTSSMQDHAVVIDVRPSSSLPQEGEFIL